MLGRDVCAAVVDAGFDVVALARGDLDVTDARAVQAAFDAEKPDVAINCAAYTNVDAAEDDEAAATVLNGDAAGYVAAAAPVVVQVSTDYVFDGTKREPYLESDPVAPIGAYGRSKLAGERAVAAANPRHFIVRTSWLYGAAGKNFVDTMLTVGAARDELNVVHDQVGCPTYTAHLAQALVKLAGRTSDYGTYHIAGSGECSWFEFASEIFRVTELDVRVMPCTTADFPRPAPRPSYSVLRSEREGRLELPDWHRGLAAYLAERAAIYEEKAAAAR